MALEPGLLDDPDLPDHWRYWLQTAQTTQWTDAAAVAATIQQCIGAVLHVMPPPMPPASMRPAHFSPQPQFRTEPAGTSQRTQSKSNTLLMVGVTALVVLAALVGSMAIGLLSRVGPATVSSGSTASASGSPTPTGAAGASPTVTRTHGSVVTVATQRDSWGEASVG